MSMTVSATNRVISSPIITRGIPIFPDAPMMAVKVPKMNLKKKHIILWVPGTNDHLIPAKFIESVKQMFGDDAEVILCDYPATQEYFTSRTVGEQTLRATLDYLRAHKGTDTKVYVAGLSQGAMASTAVLSDPKYMSFIERAVFMGHPGMANNHFDNHSKVKEINHFLDPVTFVWADDDRDAVVQKVEKFLKGDILAGVGLLSVVLSHPIQAAWFGLLYLHRVPLLHFPQIVHDPHDYTGDMDDAASWLNVGNLS